MEYEFEKFNKSEESYRRLRSEDINNPHWEDINFDEIEQDDVLLLDKFEEGKLTEKEVDQRIEELEKEGKDSDDSSYALSTMLKNKLIGQEGFKKNKKHEQERQEKQSSTEAGQAV